MSDLTNLVIWGTSCPKFIVDDNEGSNLVDTQGSEAYIVNWGGELFLYIDGSEPAPIYSFVEDDWEAISLSSASSWLREKIKSED